MPHNSILPEAIKNKYSREITFIRSCAHMCITIQNDHESGHLRPPSR